MSKVYDGYMKKKTKTGTPFIVLLETIAIHKWRFVLNIITYAFRFSLLKNAPIELNQPTINSLINNKCKKNTNKKPNESPFPMAEEPGDTGNHFTPRNSALLRVFFLSYLSLSHHYDSSFVLYPAPYCSLLIYITPQAH